MEESSSDYLRKLRRKAEKIVGRDVDANVDSMSVVEIQALIYELQTHQIELEMQNEELRQAQNELVLTRDELASLFDRAPVGYLTLNEKSLILKANLTFAEMVGKERASLANQPFSAFIVPEDQDTYYIHRRKLLETREKQTCEFRLCNADDEDLWVRTVCVCVDDSATDELRLRATISNISELKIAEQKRREIEIRMHEAQKLESLGVLAGGIAHDFNNLLMAVLGNIELAQDDLSPVSPARESIGRAGDSAKRAAELSRQMLIYSGRGSFVRQPIDLNEVVDEMAHLLQSVISKKIELKYNLNTGLPAIEADATEIRQVVLNLITNAAEAIGEETGTVTIATRFSEYGQDDSGMVRTGEGQTGEGFVRLDVTDTGCGMDRETRQKIFDPFFSTKFTGRGLGLAAVHGIVLGHHGLLQVTSAPDRGSEFSILFPASRFPAETIPADEPGDEDSIKGGVVLVVDDEDSVRSLEERTLIKAGYEVLTARDGREAVDLFREHEDRINVIVLDLTMPRMSGAEAFHEIRRISAHVPVLLASGYTEEQVKANLDDDLHPFGFIHKPCRPINLVRIVQSAMDG